MINLLITLVICGTIIWVTRKPISFNIHKSFEEIIPEHELTKEDKEYIEESDKKAAEETQGLTDLIQATQEFLGGDLDEADRPTKE